MLLPQDVTGAGCIITQDNTSRHAHPSPSQIFYQREASFIHFNTPGSGKLTTSLGGVYAGSLPHTETPGCLARHLQLTSHCSLIFLQEGSLPNSLSPVDTQQLHSFALPPAGQTALLLAGVCK